MRSTDRATIIQFTAMKFNTLKSNTAATTNHEGAKAYRMSPEMELYTAVVTASLSNKFYEKQTKTLQRIVELVGKVDPRFVAKLAIYTREKMYLRSIPMVLTVELAKVHRGDSLVKDTVKRVIQRADEITEMLAYYQLSNAREGEKKLNKLSKQVQKGIAASFNKFDEYQFAKYNRATDVTLKDALFLTHPKANSDEQQALFNKIVNNTLEVPYTWEVELSRLGQASYESEAAKKAAFTAKWEELIDSGKLGYMALMRNMRNILQAEVSSLHARKVATRLADPHQVRNSKQLPFRFLAAYREIRQVNSMHTSYFLSSLEKAVKVSAENIKGFDLDTRLVLAADVSGSMYSPVSAKSKIRCYDIGLTLSMLMRYRSENVITGIFGDRWKTVNLPQDSILSNTEKLNKIEGSVGYATNGHAVIDYLISKSQVVDKVMIFTDLQMWDNHHVGASLKNSWQAYKTYTAPNAKLYLFDLQGYGNTPLRINGNDVFLIAGWSDKIFDVLAAIESGSNALNEIDKIEI